MYQKLSLILLILFATISCSKKEELSIKPPDEGKAYEIYNDALTSMKKGEFFYAANKFSEAEKILPVIEHSAKASLMTGFCYYSINFYEEAISSLEDFLRKYPADKNQAYANYLIVLSNYEQILDEEKDIGPLLKSREIINLYIKKYPDTDYSLDLKFKLALIKNQLAAKEIYVAKYYIKTQKWIPAINRLKNVIENYEETIFVEEALHRLVEIYYNLGLIDEANKAARILGYNYNSGEWYENTYALLNKDYKKEQLKLRKKSKKNEIGLVKRTINKILKK